MDKRPILICDTECYTNYWLIKFYNPELPGTACLKFELFPDTKLDIPGLCEILYNYTIITFNGINYDLPIITLALNRATCKELKTASDTIITRGMKWWEFYRAYDVTIPAFVDHIDICEVLKGVGVSLKKYGGRLHSKKLQDLPIPPDAILTPQQVTQIDTYCTNDLLTTYDAYLSCKAAIDLRCDISDLYHVDVRSKSDAQIAEAIIKVELGFKPEKASWPKHVPVRYEPPDFIKFSGSYLNGILEQIKATEFFIDEKASIVIPDAIKKLTIQIGDTNYQMGVGGLHSTEESVSHYADNHHEIIDADVTSYYPSLILLCDMYPKQLGEKFLHIYRKIYEERIAAKKSGDKLRSECYKIVMNGSFGKFNSQYSILYAPDLMLKVTLTGQLAILMLIECLEDAGIRIVSANTDGIVMICMHSHRFIKDCLIELWELRTGLKLEFANYEALYSRDVNNYIAVKKNKEIKLKGVFANPSVEKDPHNHICVKAVINYLVHAIPIEKTVTECTDIREFITVRYVKGGAVHIDHKELPPHDSKEELVMDIAGYGKYQDGRKVRYSPPSGEGEYTLGEAYKFVCEQLQAGEKSDVLGKVVRWVTIEGNKSHLAYATNGNKVPDSVGARPMMELSDILPDDIDYAAYIRESIDILKTLGIHYENL